MAADHVIGAVADAPETNSFLSFQSVGNEDDVSITESLLVETTSLGKTTLAKAECGTDEQDQLVLRGEENGGDCDEDLLEGLKPHTNLQTLDMGGFGSKILPSWILRSHLNNLVELTIRDCPNLESIPVMRGLQCLKELRVWECKGLVDGAFSFPSLSVLDIRGCPSLQKLEVTDCRELVCISNNDLSSCTRLTAFNLCKCSKLKTFPSLHGLSFLKELHVWENYGLMSLPDGLASCTALERLVAYGGCMESVPEDLKRLCSLVDLQIFGCPRLSSFPEEILGCLTSLKTLIMGGYSNELKEFPGLGSINNLSASLECLVLYGWKNLVTQFPHQIQGLRALKELSIDKFPRLEALPEWLGELTSLKSLDIMSCDGLKDLRSGLPSCTGLEELQISCCNNLISVPEELKELRSLVRLTIYKCRNLRSFSDEILGSLARLTDLDLGFFSEELEEFVGLGSIHHLHSSLRKFDLTGWEKLTELPPQIQHLTALEQLRTANFTGLKGPPDWSGNLPSLQTLWISNSPNMNSLPSAETIERLSKLNKLRVSWPEFMEKIQQEKQCRVTE